MDKYSDISDNKLTYWIKKNEKGAYHELYKRYAPRIYQFSLSYLKNENDSEELVQIVFLKIWEKRNLIDSSQNIKAFIFKIAVNTIYDFIRRKNIKNAFEDYIRLNYNSDENSTWHSVIFEELQQKLQKLVNRMPDQQKRIFQLSKLEGLSNDEIANKLNLSKRTVENHLYRAISFLKKHFQAESIIAILFVYLICG